MADPGFERQCITWIYMVRTYLTRACSDKRNCRKSNCDRYHQPGEKRRNPIGAGDRIMYETNYDKRNPKEPECLNLNERLYHPRLYKARPCNVSIGRVGSGVLCVCVSWVGWFFWLGSG